MKKKSGLIITIIIAVAAVACVAVAVAGFHMRRSGSLGIETSGTDTTDSEVTSSTAAEYDYDSLAAVLTESTGKEITADMLKGPGLSSDKLNLLETEGKTGEITSGRFHEITGYTINAFRDKFGSGSSKDMGSNGSDKFVLGFTGDINFDETSYYVMVHALTKENVVLDCIDETLQNEMKSADIMLINNEFTYSTRGTPTPGKKYTFRAKPEYVQYLVDLGVDIVSLANNHAHDYGDESFTDTMDTLTDAGIIYVGAGNNSGEANAPKTFLINGYKVGYLACCGVEWPVYTPVATETSGGIMGSYDGGEAMTEAIKKAKQDCDYVIVYPHWGYENMTTLSDAQISNSRQWIDAGADAIIGNHSHCLQGMDYYKGKFIAYSLGNFWFNSKNEYTGLLKLEISEDGITPVFVPGKQWDRETSYISDPETQRTVYDLIEGYPTVNGVKIDDNGVISEK